MLKIQCQCQVVIVVEILEDNWEVVETMDEHGPVELSSEDTVVAPDGETQTRNLEKCRSEQQHRMKQEHERQYTQ